MCIDICLSNITSKIFKIFWVWLFWLCFGLVLMKIFYYIFDGKHCGMHWNLLCTWFPGKYILKCCRSAGGGCGADGDVGGVVEAGAGSGSTVK